MTDTLWMPVVYGRTRRADQWWRVLPLTMDRAWAQQVVRSVTGGGVGLEGGTRLMLARGAGFSLVGGACRARHLSERMHTEGRRPLYCFVGWAAEADDVRDALPSLRELTEGFDGWAAAVYDHWVGLDWHLHESQLRQPRDSVPGPPPWIASASRRDQPRPPIPTDATVAWPESEAAIAWDLLRESMDPGLLVTGWQRLEDAEATPGAWIASADVIAVGVMDTTVLPRAPAVDAPPWGPVDDIPEQPVVASPVPGHKGSGVTRTVTRGEQLERDAWSRVRELPPQTSEDGEDAGFDDSRDSPALLDRFLRKLKDPRGRRSVQDPPMEADRDERRADRPRRGSG